MLFLLTVLMINKLFSKQGVITLMMIDSSAVQAAMLRLGVGVTALAKLAGIPPKTISALHRRDKPVYLPTLARLAKALKVEPMTLVKLVC